MSELTIELTPSFERDFQRLPEDIQERVEACINDLAVSGRRRVHSVTPKGKKPTVFSADVTANKAYKLTFHRSGSTLTLRRVGTHRQIDRAW